MFTQVPAEAGSAGKYVRWAIYAADFYRMNDSSWDGLIWSSDGLQWVRHARATCGRASGVPYACAVFI